MQHSSFVVRGLNVVYGKEKDYRKATGTMGEAIYIAVKHHVD